MPKNRTKARGVFNYFYCFIFCKVLYFEKSTQTGGEGAAIQKRKPRLRRLV